MTLYDFNLLSLEDMQKVVWEHGVFLDNYITKDIRLNCYAVDKFYVELVYDSEANKISEIRSFKSGLHLDKYTNDIEL